MAKDIVDVTITFAGASFEFGSIENDDLPAAIFNKARSLERTRSRGDTCARNPESLSDGFLGKMQIIGSHPILNLKKPAAEIFFERMKAVTDR